MSVAVRDVSAALNLTSGSAGRPEAAPTFGDQGQISVTRVPLFRSQLCSRPGCHPWAAGTSVSFSSGGRSLKPLSSWAGGGVSVGFHWLHLGGRGPAGHGLSVLTFTRSRPGVQRGRPVVQAPSLQCRAVRCSTPSHQWRGCLPLWFKCTFPGTDEVLHLFPCACALPRQQLRQGSSCPNLLPVVKSRLLSFR